jgi:hypothetical protein
MAKRGALKRRRIEYSVDGSIARITYEFYQFDPADKPNNTCEVFDDLLQVQGYYKKKQCLTKVRFFAHVSNHVASSLIKL